MNVLQADICQVQDNQIIVQVNRQEFINYTGYCFFQTINLLKFQKKIEVRINRGSHRHGN